MPVGYGPVSRTARTLRPVAVLVLAIRSTMTWWLVSGRPRQFRVIWENSRCSILFHLLVPGGRWATVTVSPVPAAKAASLILQARIRDPLEPPPSAQISSRSTVGTRPRHRGGHDLQGCAAHGADQLLAVLRAGQLLRPHPRCLHPRGHIQPGRGLLVPGGGDELLDRSESCVGSGAGCGLLGI